MTSHRFPGVARPLKAAFTAVWVVMICAGTAAGAQIGAGTDIPNETVDTPNTGGRINVDQGSPLSLPAGTYVATLFRYDAGQTGDVTPFLAVSATGSDPTDLYTAIAVGDTLNVDVAFTDQSVPFGGSATFTLDAPAVVYAGISSSVQNPVFLDNGTGPNTDHEAAGAASYVVTLGGMVPPDGAFSHVQLGRTYAFAIEVELIPEPSAGLMVLAGLAWCGRRRRRQ